MTLATDYTHNLFQVSLFPDFGFQSYKKTYRPVLTATVNRKGVLDVDTVKGCAFGMAAYPDGGCYNECYACKTATMYGRDFAKSVSRGFMGNDHLVTVLGAVVDHPAWWYRVGTFGDPCHDWPHTLEILNWLSLTEKVPVIITKHWRTLTDEQIKELRKLGAVVNTSVSGMDTNAEIRHRVGQLRRLRVAGVRSVCRVVTCNYGLSEWARLCRHKQEFLLSLLPVIDNPLRASANNPRVISGDIHVTKRSDSVGGGTLVSLHSESVYLGRCNDCPDQCGVGLRDNTNDKEKANMEDAQLKLIEERVEFLHVPSVIGSGFETQVADLALRDKVAYRAARKNMQIHSAIILKINGEFSGFFTFQVNHEIGEFCLLQSAMELDRKDREIYKAMLREIIKQNIYGYPMLMTVSTKHDLERPDVLAECGFWTYLELSGFAYMVYGTPEQVRLKRLAHATMTNVWHTTKADWMRMKREWNEKIEAAGEKHGIKNPKYASRDGCWQGENGMGNVVLAKQTVENGEIVHHSGKTLNGNASVLDPVACEVIVRFFMPKDGRRVFNPFGGGVQMGFVSGSYGYEYVASEIRANQCDANNAICKDLNSAKWIKGDSTKFVPEGKFDLCFACPPYYQVEEYLDYEGKIPEGELNSLPSYESFRDALFEGYKIGIAALKDDSFFVIMTGDSRDKNGGYYGCEAEHELFFKGQGLHIYNRIVYLESEFTRLAHAKKTLNYRKFPKTEQKILVFYKGDTLKIKERFQPIGRL